jgi:hypothetical protein
MSTHAPRPAAVQQPSPHGLPTGWSVRPPANERTTPSNLTACDVLAQLLLERLTVGIDLTSEGLALDDALVDFLVPDEVGEGGCDGPPPQIHHGSPRYSNPWPPGASLTPPPPKPHRHRLPSPTPP